MEKQSKPAPDERLLALRCARAWRLLASLRRPPAPPPPQLSCRIPSPAAVECRLVLRNYRLLRAEVSAARREAAAHARIAGSELLLALTVVPLVLLLFLLLGLLAGAP